MPVLPHRNLKKYSSLPADSPSSAQVQSPRPKLQHSTSAPAGGNPLVNAFQLIKNKFSDHSDGPDDLGDSREPDTSRMTSSPRRSPSPDEGPDRPHLSPYFQHKRKPDLTGSTEEEKKKFEMDASDGRKRPTLNPFFNANHHFIKALRRMGSRDNFSRLKPGRDD